MAVENTIDLLNELLVLHHRSLPMYLTVASPWSHRGDEKATETVQDVIADQKAISQRIADEIQLRGGTVEPGVYPTDFTDLHFLSLDYLLCQLVAAQKNDVAAIEQCVERLAHDPPARAMAQESLGTARGHLQSLEELATELSVPS